MSRFFLSIKHAPLVAIQISEDLIEKFKPPMFEIFGIKFLQSEYINQDRLYMYDFEADDEEIEKVYSVLKDMVEKRKHNIDIDINFN